MTQLFDHPYASFLAQVSKPNRYTGSEFGVVRKDWDATSTRVCLAFPDVYDIGMSHLGYRILYKLLNDDPEILAERCYAPYVDMLAELETRDLPLASLESVRPLCDFDVVGFSLQFELTYTNILLMLDRGRIPLFAVERGENDPLVIAGGPVATHAEPMAPFFDALLIGDGEEAAREMAVSWTSGKRAGKTRRQRLEDLAQIAGVYVPSLYEIAPDAETGLYVVQPPTEPGYHGKLAPFPIERRLVPDINAYPFPDDFPVGGPEAIFDRMSIEVARGCTEGCRFCQAGMIYRPVRERDPQTVVDTVMRALEKSGQDEVSLTALSTADVSCISPLIKRLVEKTAPERVSLSVASLRAYGLAEDLLDDMRRVRTAGLTFAPEAGTQRMRDVINKNVTEEQLLETAERVFSRGFDKMKLYFILGLPTEEDEDVLGIAEVGKNAMAVGRRVGKRSQVTVSVSVHVPKPHTPFQWCKMDEPEEVRRKQQLLRDALRGRKGITLKLHDSSTSELEGVLARGDRRLADVIARAYRLGARFDSWNDQFKAEAWSTAFAEYGIDTAPLLATLPVSARLPWDHIDVGLEDGFLEREYRKALQSRLSPPCGKAKGMFVHHPSVEEAAADSRKLVCYDCGIACDLSRMRGERISFLQKMGAEKSGERARLPVVGQAQGPVPEGQRKELVPQGQPIAGEAEALALEAQAPETELQSASAGGGGGEPAVLPLRPSRSRSPERFRPSQPGSPPERFRLRYAKLGPSALLGHLDFIRELPRVIRRAGVRTSYTAGFHPKPDMSFGPALALGIASLDEYVDIKLIDAPDADELVRRLNRVTAGGVLFLGAARLGSEDKGLSKLVDEAEYVIGFPKAAFERAALAGATAAPGPSQPGALQGESFAADAAVGLCSWLRTFQEKEEAIVFRDVKGLKRKVDVKAGVSSLWLGTGADLDAIREAGVVGELACVGLRVPLSQSGAVRTREVVEALTGSADTPYVAVRTRLFASGKKLLDLVDHRREVPARLPEAAEVSLTL